MSNLRTRSPSVWLWPLILAVVVSGVLALIVWWPASTALEKEISARERARVEDQLAIIGTAVQRSLRNRITILESIAAFVESEGLVGEGVAIAETRERFAEFAAHLPFEEAGIRRAWIARSGVVATVAPPSDNAGVLGRLHPLANAGSAPGGIRAGLGIVTTQNGEDLVYAVMNLVVEGPPSAQVGIDFRVPTLAAEANLGRYGQNIVVILRDSRGSDVFSTAPGELREPATYPVAVSREFWELAAVPIGGWGDDASTFVPLFQAVGWAVSALLGLFVLFIRSKRARRLRRMRHMETEIENERSRFNEISSSIPGAMFRLVRKPSGLIEYSFLSDGARDILGIDPAQAKADSSWVRRSIHPDDRSGFDDMLNASVASQTQATFEFRTASSEGEPKWLRAVSLPRLRPNGDVIWSGHISDITAARHSLDRLVEKEALYRAAFDSHPNGAALYARSDGLAESNDAAQQIFGSAIPPLAGSDLEQDSDVSKAGFSRVRRPDGTNAWIQTDSRLIVPAGETGRAAFLHTFTDVSGARDREARLIGELKTYQAAFESSLDALWESDADLRLTSLSGSGGGPSTLGVLAGTSLLDLGSLDDQEETLAIQEQIRAHETFRHLVYEFADPESGDARILHFSGTAVLDQTGDFAGYRGGVWVQNIASPDTGIAREQADLLAGLSRAADDLPVGIVIFDDDGRTKFRNPAFDLMEPNTDLFEPNVSPEDFGQKVRERGLGRETDDEGDAGAGPISDADVFFEGWIGPSWLQIRRHEIPVGGILFVVSDLSDLRAEDENAVRQQAVDAAFDAATRIAGDLNYALADTLSGLAQLKEHSAGTGAASATEDLLVSSERGAVLGMQLLALLQRKTLGSAQADVSKLVPGANDVLRVALRDRVDLAGYTADTIAATNVDPVMLEYIVLNLIAKTQAELPDTTNIQVLTHSAVLEDEAAEALGVPAGRYVILDIIHPAAATATLLQLRLHAQGLAGAANGSHDDLGLNLAARFLRQSGGHIAVVASEDGRATLKILLPHQGREAEQRTGVPGPDLVPYPGVPARRNAVLLESDGDVRRVTATLLHQLNYDVLVAQDPEQALAHNESAAMDLLMTENRLPGEWTGEALAARMREAAPNLQVVLTSATGLVAAEAGLSGAALLLKPYGLDELSALLSA